MISQEVPLRDLQSILSTVALVVKEFPAYFTDAITTLNAFQSLIDEYKKEVEALIEDESQEESNSDDDDHISERFRSTVFNVMQSATASRLSRKRNRGETAFAGNSENIEPVVTIKRRALEILQQEEKDREHRILLEKFNSPGPRKKNTLESKCQDLAHNISEWLQDILTAWLVPPTSFVGYEILYQCRLEALEKVENTVFDLILVHFACFAHKANFQWGYVF
jgi:hypothetical protein